MTTWMACAPPKLARWAARSDTANVPAAETVNAWDTLPSPCRNATCPPSGADGLPEVKALALPLTPLAPVKDHAEPAGLYWNAAGPAPTPGDSKPPCATPPDTGGGGETGGGGLTGG